jgi:hypothetical protein
MKFIILLHGSGFAKILALITAFCWEGINKTPGNYYKLNRPETLNLQAFTNSPQQQLSKTNPYSGVLLIVPFNHFFIYKSDNYVSTNHA